MPSSRLCPPSSSRVENHSAAEHPLSPRRATAKLYSRCREAFTRLQMMLATPLKGRSLAPLLLLLALLALSFAPGILARDHEDALLDEHIHGGDYAVIKQSAHSSSKVKISGTEFEVNAQAGIDDELEAEFEAEEEAELEAEEEAEFEAEEEAEFEAEEEAEFEAEEAEFEAEEEAELEAEEEAELEGSRVQVDIKQSAHSSSRVKISGTEIEVNAQADVDDGLEAELEAEEEAEFEAEFEAEEEAEEEAEIEAEEEAEEEAEIEAEYEAEYEAEEVVEQSGEIEVEIEVDDEANEDLEFEAEFEAEEEAEEEAEIEAEFEAEQEFELEEEINGEFEVDERTEVKSKSKTKIKEKYHEEEHIDEHYEFEENINFEYQEVEVEEINYDIVEEIKPKRHFRIPIIEDEDFVSRRYQDLETVQNFREYVEGEIDCIRGDFYLDGSDNSTTERDNDRAFDRYKLRPRVNRHVSKPRTGVEILNHFASFPLGLAPIPFLEWTHPDGEIGAARAAQSFIVPMIVSAFSNTYLEEIRFSAPKARLWMETYIFRNRGITENIVKRAENCGYQAIVVTVDLPVYGGLYHDRRNGFVLPSYLRVPNIEDYEVDIELPDLDFDLDFEGDIGDEYDVQ